MALDQNDRTLVERVDPLVGAVLDRRFRIEFRLAAGGFGAIYRARHVSSNHEVALKVLHPQLTNDAGVVARFRREGATLTTLRSPHTITAYELGEASDGTLYIVMELLLGVSLYERYRSNGRIPWKRMAAIARAVCSSLEEAHGLGIVHRDLKPTNIHLERMGDDDDYVKVLDFGIAKILRDSDFDSSDLTNAGQMIGTLDYMSPEQMVSGVCTGQSDIYTLGIVMYEMIAGRRPFEDTNSPAVALASMLKGTAPALSTHVAVPAELDAIVMRCLEREPQNRYPDVGALGEDLEALLGGPDSSEVTRTVPVDLDALTRGGPTDRLQAEDESTMIATPPPPRPSGRPPTNPPPVRHTAPGMPVPVPQTPLPGYRPSQPVVRPTPSPIQLAQAQARARGGTTPPPTAFVPPGRAHPPTPPPPYGAAPLPVMDPPSRPVLDLNAFPRTPMHGTPQSQFPPTPSPQFDMAQIASRDAAMRTIVWIVLVVIGIGVGIGVATQL